MGQSRKKKEIKESKTMRGAKVNEVIFLKDESINAESRIAEVRNLVAQMIEMSHQRGRPKKSTKEIENAA